jgi:hypothetical protein
LSFNVSAEELAKATAWQCKHDREKHASQFKHGTRYSGAIGGAYTWCFTPTGIGTVVKVRCSCGEELDLTDYGSW